MFVGHYSVAFAVRTEQNKIPLWVLIVAVAVFSHWILDLIAHPHDLPIYDNAAQVGFGLWNYRDPEFAVEIGLLAVGIVLYLARNVIPAIRKAAVIAFGIALVVIQIG